ncbi:MAG: class F sortase [Candidatus Paceibacterota bacterium]
MILFKFSLKWSWLIFSIVGIIFFLTFFLLQNYDRGVGLWNDEGLSQLPMRLKIPLINVDAGVEKVGLTKEGVMGVPKGPAEVAWYMLGSKPGEFGSAVIAGHSGYKNNQPAVFDNLYKLKKGDKIYVEDDVGKVITFIVRESRSYDSNADASSVFNSSDGLAHLNLITCSGYWNEIEKTHSSRLVIFTDKEVE